MEICYAICLSFLLALICELLIHKQLVLLSKKKRLTDNPNSRKLNKRPVPVLGGVAVYFGVLISVSVLYLISPEEYIIMFPLFLVMTGMLLIGVIDDLVDLKFGVKFFFQFFAVTTLVFHGEYLIDDLNGLWGVHQLPYWLSLFITFFVGVGVINSINLVDGVDGLSSGLSILTATTFGIYFVLDGHYVLATLAFALIGAIIPFLLHNIFGRKYKMYIGDAGALMVGTIFTAMIFKIVNSYDSSPHLNGVTSFLIAALCIPVFDTVRVMMFRMFRGLSPFHADKTHLHHKLIEMGLSHVMVSMMEITLNLIVILVWLVLDLTKVDVDIQFYIVVALGILFTVGIYHTLDYIQKHHPKRLAPIKRFIKKHKPTRGSWYIWMRKMLDKNWQMY